VTPAELAEVLAAGADAIPSKSEQAANALALALDAMAGKCAEIAARQSPTHTADCTPGCFADHRKDG
jgi:hypothetical protein